MICSDARMRKNPYLYGPAQSGHTEESMNDEQLNTFLTVAETGSFSKAGEGSYVSKQAMLRQIDLLEQELGFRLFERTRRGTMLTPAGAAFHKGIRKILRDRKKLVDDCRKTAGILDVIRVGNVEHQALLTPVTQAFTVRYPQIHVRHIIHPNHSGEWRVENGIQDVAETFFSPRTLKADYRYIPLTKVPYIAAMDGAHPLAGRGKLSLTALCPYETMIFPIMLGDVYTQQMRDAFRGTPDHLIERSDVDNQVQAAYECLGTKRVLITANPFIEGIGELIKVPLDTEWEREYGIIYKEPASEPVQKYIALAREIYE